MGTLRSIVGLGLRSSTSGLTDTNIYEKGIAIQQNGRMAEWHWEHLLLHRIELPRSMATQYRHESRLNQLTDNK